MAKRASLAGKVTKVDQADQVRKELSVLRS